MELDHIFMNNKIKKIKVTDEVYSKLRILVARGSSRGPLDSVANFNAVPIEIDNDVKNGWEIEYYG